MKMCCLCRDEEATKYCENDNNYFCDECDVKTHDS